MKRLKIRVLVAVTCGWVVLGLSGAAVGSVVPNACIAGIGLWDSKDRVAREWGPPNRKVKDWAQQLGWHYPNGTVYFVQFSPSRWIVARIVTTDPSERLNGLGVGSWRSEVHAATRRCPGFLTYCHIATSNHWRRATTVRFDRDRVIELSVHQSEWNERRSARQPDKRCRTSK